MKRNKRRPVTTKSIFTISIIITILIILLIWISGLGQHRTLYQNSIISTSILSSAFFLFITIGLYRGIKLKDNIGKITDKIEPSKFPNFIDSLSGAELGGGGDDIGSIIVSIVLWILVTVLAAILIWLFGAILWTGAIIFIAMLYWIFFRALRLVFKKSSICRNNLLKSTFYGLGFTLLYNFWIYTIIIGAHYLIK